MKTKSIIIIIAIIIGVISSGTLSYFAYQMNQCESLPGYMHYPRPGIWNCLKFIDDHEKQMKSSENNQVEQNMTLEVFSQEMAEGVAWTIQGKVDPVILDTSVNLLILKDGDLVEVKQLAVVVDDGLYKTSIVPKGPAWDEPGEYIVRVSYGPELVIEKLLEHDPESEPSALSNPALLTEYPQIKQNDMYCWTQWYMKNTTIDEEKLILSIQSTISEFGSHVDVPEREITVYYNEDETVISIAGIWTEDQNQHKELTSIVKNHIGDSEIIRDDIIMCA